MSERMFGQTSDRLNPSFTAKDEEAGVPEELDPVIMGPPGYASPDPRTSQAALVPIEEHPLAADLSPDYAKDEIAMGHDSEMRTSMTPPDGPQSVGTDGAATPLPDNPDEATKADWQAAAKSRGLSTSGSKDAIRKRVEDHEAELEYDASLQASDWIDEVQGVETADELAALRGRYGAAGNEYVTVEQAFDKKQAELDNPDGEQ